MYNEVTLKKIAEVLKLDASIFMTNLKSDKEETLEVPVLYSEDDKTAFGKNRFEEGKRAMSEITAKDLKEKHGIDITSKKLDEVIDAIADKRIAEAKIDTPEKIKNLEKEKKELQLKVVASEEKIQNITKESADRLFHVETRNQIFTHIPKNTIIPADDLAELFMNRYRVTKEDDRVIVHKGDQKLVDNVLNPIPLKDVVLQFSEAYINRNGMGGGDGGGGTTSKFKTMTEALAYMEKNHIEPMSPEGLKLLKENKEAAFDYNS